jgi:hypothetical protein
MRKDRMATYEGPNRDPTGLAWDPIKHFKVVQTTRNSGWIDGWMDGWMDRVAKKPCHRIVHVLEVVLTKD